MQIGPRNRGGQYLFKGKAASKIVQVVVVGTS